MPLFHKILILSMALLLAACAGTADATEDPNAIMTQSIGTMVGSTATFVFYSPTPGTITPTGTLSTATINPGSLAVGCNNLAFVCDVNIPSGSVLPKSKDMTKTWKVENNGTCNWMYQYSLVLL